MKLISSVLMVLMVVNAVNSAAMREGSEDLLRFLNDAFQMNLPSENLEPQITEVAPVTEMILYPTESSYPTDPTAECKAPEIVDVAEFSNTTPEPNLTEDTDIAEERSIESSNSDSRFTDRTSTEDSRDAERNKRLQKRSKLTDAQKQLQEQYTNSEESDSVDTTDMDTEVMKDIYKHPNKLTVMTDISSQEMAKPVENMRYRSLKTIGINNAEMTGAPVGQKNYLMKENHSIIQFSAGQTNLKDLSGQPHETDKQIYERTVDFDSPEIVDPPDRHIQDAASEEFDGGVARRTVRIISDQTSMLRSNNQTDKNLENEKLKKVNLTLVAGSQDTENNSTDNTGLNSLCTEISAESPTEKNSLVDQKIQKNMRKICPGKRVRTLKNLREQLDFDSPERVSDELLDYSNERQNEHVAVTL